MNFLIPEDKFDRFFTELEELYEGKLSSKDLKKKFGEILNERFKNMFIYSYSDMSTELCSAIIQSGKNKGNMCNKKATNGAYCKIHVKNDQEQLTDNDEDIEELSSSYEKKIIRNTPSKEGSRPALEDSSRMVLVKNKYGNFTYGTSGLILKQIDNKVYVVAREGMNGEWRQLTENDIEMCKKYRLRHKIINPKPPKIGINTLEYTKKLLMEEMRGDQNWDSD